MNSSQVGVFKEGDKISCMKHEYGTNENMLSTLTLTGLLQGQDSRRLEAEVGLEILSDFTNETLEGELPDKELSRLLVATDFTKSDGSRTEPMRLLHASSSSLSYHLSEYERHTS